MLRRTALLLALATVVGCQTPERGPETGTGTGTRTLPASGKGGGLGPTFPEAAPATNTPPATVILPASGKIHSVNAGLKFVVIDYTLGGMPPLQSVLGVYRGSEKIGQLRLSGPERNGFVAADVLEGFLQPGDEVRLD